MTNLTKNTTPKYEYCLKTWGGFFNEEFAKEHLYNPGVRFFDTEKEREVYLGQMRWWEIELNARHLTALKVEGYNLERTVVHRITEWEGESYYTSSEMTYGLTPEVAQYHLDSQWTPGHNDYPLGEDFDYETNKVTIIQEWFTGTICDKKK